MNLSTDNLYLINSTLETYHIDQLLIQLKQKSRSSSKDAFCFISGFLLGVHRREKVRQTMENLPPQNSPFVELSKNEVLFLQTIASNGLFKSQ